MPQNAVFEKMIDLDAKKVMFVIKIIELDVKIFAKKIMIALIFEIDSIVIYITIVLMN